MHSRAARTFTGPEARDIEAAAEGLVLSLALLDARPGRIQTNVSG